jgi:arylsulfatase A-like enzyme
LICAQAVLAALLVAAMEAVLIQWTSYSVPLSVLGIDFVVSALVLAIVIAPIVVGLSLVRRGSARTFLTATVLALALYDLSRIHTEALSWLDSTVFALIVILAIGCWIALRPARKGETPEATDLVCAPLLVGATGATWALHVQSFTPTIAVLVLLASMSVLQAACGRWLLASEASAPRRSIVAALSALAIAIVFSVASYPLAPGAVKLETRRQGGEAPVAAATLPNVVVVVMDTVRADHLSLYGYAHPTSPQLVEFAKRAHVFRSAVANSGWSLPSHATLLTGLLPHQHGAHTVIASLRQGRDPADATLGEIAHQPLPSSSKTITARLREIGYDTGLVAANYGWVSEDWGLVRGFHYVDSQPRSLVALDPFCGAYLRHQPIHALAALYERSSRPSLFADEVVEQAVDFLGRQRQRPFFLFLNFMDAHAPYASAARAEAVPEIRERFRRARWPATNVEGYDRSIAFLDDQLGRFFGELKRRGLFEDSLIVITSDHGEQFGPSGQGWHGDDLSQSVLHIPLLIKMPRQTEGETVDHLAQLADVAPTILEAAGLPIPREFFGSPLARRSRAVIAENYLSAGGIGGDTLPSRGPARLVSMETLEESLPTQWALFEGKWKLVRDAKGREFLYDLSDDPGESANLAERRPEITREMAERLAALLPPDVFTRYRVPVVQAGVAPAAIEKLKSLGYAH